jgi:outer membrane receptor protein involved in Fe transport
MAARRIAPAYLGVTDLRTKPTRARLMATTMICGAAVAVFGAGQASAQTTAPADQTEVEEIVVTGSLFRRTDTETPSPVTVLTSQNLQRAGMTTATDAIRSVSADGAGSIGTGFQSGFSAGGSAVSLRGLGVSSTLVLVDGLRSANFPINDDGHNAYVDLNSIPFSLIDRIEVLKDGASSSYGADAIGGVVNLILKKQFEGVSGSAEFGQSQERDARHQRFDLTLGYGDYAEKGWNFYVNGEYQKDGRVSSHSRGFPYNTQDLRPIGGLDNNTADSSPDDRHADRGRRAHHPERPEQSAVGRRAPFPTAPMSTPRASPSPTATTPRWAWEPVWPAPTPSPAAARAARAASMIWSTSTTRSSPSRSATRSTAA